MASLCALQAFRHLWALATRSGALADAVDVDTLQHVRAPLSLSRRRHQSQQPADERKQQERGHAQGAEGEGQATGAEVLLSSATPCLLPEVYQVGPLPLTQVIVTWGFLLYGALCSGFLLTSALPGLGASSCSTS